MPAAADLTPEQTLQSLLTQHRVLTKLSSTHVLQEINEEVRTSSPSSAASSSAADSQTLLARRITVCVKALTPNGITEEEMYSSPEAFHAAVVAKQSSNPSDSTNNNDNYFIIDFLTAVDPRAEATLFSSSVDAAPQHRLLKVSVLGLLSGELITKMSEALPAYHTSPTYQHINNAVSRIPSSSLPSNPKATLLSVLEKNLKPMPQTISQAAIRELVQYSLKKTDVKEAMEFFCTELPFLGQH